MSGLSLAVVSGVAVFVLGQALLRFVLEPIQRQREVIGEIAGVLVMYANVRDAWRHKTQEEVRLAQHTPPDEAHRHLRQLASDLRATLYTVPGYSIWRVLRVVPHQDDVLRASSGLIGWSNCVHNGDPDPHIDAIAESLRLYR